MLTGLERRFGWPLRDPAVQRRAALVLLIILLGAGLRVQGGLTAGEVGDVAAYREHALQAINGENVYATEGKYPYFPGWLAVEVAVYRAAELLALPFDGAIRVLIVLADVLTCFALWAIGSRTRPDGRGWIAAIVYALAPIAILVSGYQGQFDAIPTLLAVIAAGLLVGRRPVWLAGIALGLAIAIKPFPALLIPLFLAAPDLTRRQRAVLAATVGGVVVAVALPSLLADARALIGDVFGYAGVQDQGLGGLLRSAWLFRTGFLDLPGNIHESLSSYSRNLALMAVALAFVITFRAPLPRAAAAVFLALLAFYSGVSTQYLLWPLVWLLLSDLPIRWPIVYSVGTAIGALSFYLVFWPELILGPPWTGIVMPFTGYYLAGQIVCWATVLVVLVATLWDRRPFALPAGRDTLARLAFVPLLGFAFFAHPVVDQIAWLAGEWVAFAPSLTSNVVASPPDWSLAPAGEEPPPDEAAPSDDGEPAPPDNGEPAPTDQLEPTARPLVHGPNSPSVAREQGLAAASVDPAAIVLDLPFDGSATTRAGATPVEAAFRPESSPAGGGITLSTEEFLVYDPIPVSADGGTIAFWVKPRWAGDDGADHVFVELGTGPTRLRLAKDAAANFQFYIWFDERQVGADMDVAGWRPNEWHHIMATWQRDGRFRLYIDWNLARDEPASLPPAFDPHIRIGTTEDGGAWCDCVLQDLIIATAAAPAPSSSP